MQFTAFLLLAPARLQQIDDWRDTRPILEGLGQMRRLDRRLQAAIQPAHIGRGAPVSAAHCTISQSAGARPERAEE